MALLFNPCSKYGAASKIPGWIKMNKGNKQISVFTLFPKHTAIHRHWQCLWDLQSCDELNPTICYLEAGTTLLGTKSWKIPGSFKPLCKTSLVLSDTGTSFFCLCGDSWRWAGQQQRWLFLCLLRRADPVLLAPQTTKRGIWWSPNTSHIFLKLISPRASFPKATTAAESGRMVLGSLQAVILLTQPCPF